MVHLRGLLSLWRHGPDPFHTQHTTQVLYTCTVEAAVIVFYDNPYSSSVNEGRKCCHHTSRSSMYNSFLICVEGFMKETIALTESQGKPNHMATKTQYRPFGLPVSQDSILLFPASTLKATPNADENPHLSPYLGKDPEG